MAHNICVNAGSIPLYAYEVSYSTYDGLNSGKFIHLYKSTSSAIMGNEDFAASVEARLKDLFQDVAVGWSFKFMNITPATATEYVYP